MEYKQVILIRMDLKLPKGKAAVQVAHASVECVLNSDKNNVKEWKKEGMGKIVVKVKDLKEMMKLKSEAKSLGLVTSVITDAGKTTVAPGTTTCVGIGPDLSDEIDKVTGDLKIL
ncbi:peptidyl-tRNA hydrolase Pth2 [Nanoarchaeota archaeon]